MKKEFKKLISDLDKDKGVVGVFLGGSRTINNKRENSDYDLGIISTNSKFKECHKRYTKFKNKYMHDGLPIFDIMVFPYSYFTKGMKKIDPIIYWYYENTNVLIDKDNKIGRLIKEMALIPKSMVDEYVRDNFNKYIYHEHNMAICLKEKNAFGARLESSAAIQSMINFVFGMDRRLTPKYKYLELTLQNRPPTHIGMSKKMFIIYLKRAAASPDRKSHRSLFMAVIKEAKKSRYNNIIKEWGNMISGILKCS